MSNSWNCPSCGKSIENRFEPGSNCPHCGKQIDSLGSDSPASDDASRTVFGTSFGTNSEENIGSDTSELISDLSKTVNEGFDVAALNEEAEKQPTVSEPEPSSGSRTVFGTISEDDLKGSGPSDPASRQTLTEGLEVESPSTASHSQTLSDEGLSIGSGTVSGTVSEDDLLGPISGANAPGISKTIADGLNLDPAGVSGSGPGADFGKTVSEESLKVDQGAEAGRTLAEKDLLLGVGAEDEGTDGDRPNALFQTLQSNGLSPKDGTVDETGSVVSQKTLPDGQWIEPAEKQTEPKDLAGQKTLAIDKTISAEDLLGPIPGVPGARTVEAGKTLDASAEGDDPTKTVVAGDKTIVAGDLSGDGDASLLRDKWNVTVQGDATIMSTLKGNEPPAKEPEDPAHLSVHERSFMPHRDNAPQRGVDYELMKMLGEGGMGVVYAARQASIDRVVAVKMLKPESVNNSGQRTKFLAEAAVTGELEHPNIVPIYDLGKNASGALFYAMKRVQGTPWHKVVASKSLAENIDILMRVADAIAFAHARGVIHRDLKPENIMLGDFGEVLVMDWGLALPVNRRSAGGINIKPTMGGTPAYMAPEMATGPFDKLGFASDVYLLGAILYEIVTGKPPHSGATVMKCLVAAARNVITPTNRTGELVDIALKAMESDPKDRYQSVLDFQQAIRDYRNHLESITLADRALEDLNRAQESQDYSVFSRSVFGFEESLALWNENRRAKQGLLDAKLKYARVAKGKGDFDLASSLLDTSIPEHNELQVEVASAVQEREARERRLASLRKAAIGMAAAMFVVVTSALVYVINANQNERIARREAEESREKAVNAQKAEAEQREVAEQNYQEAERQRVSAENNFKLAESNRMQAEKNADEARKNAEEAQSQRMIAEKNEMEAEENARIAKLNAEEAEKQRMIAEANAKTAEERRVEAVEAQKLAEEQRMAAVEAQMIAEMRRKEADDARKEEARQRELAVKAQEQAILARDEAQRQREIAEYEAYVARINAAAAKIDEQNFDQARTLLADCQPEGNEKDYRGWEWHRLWYLCHQSQRDIALEAPVESIRFSPQGDSFVIGAMDGTTQIRGVDGTLLQRLPSTGSRILATDWIADAQLIPATVDASLTSTARNDSSPLVAVGSDDRANPIQLFDPNTGKIVALLGGDEGHTDAVTSLQFSKDGTKLLSASFDRTVKLWDLQTGTVEKTFRGHRLWVWSARFSPDEQHVATASEDGTVRIWNVASGESSPPFLGHEGPVYSADFSDDGRWVASGGIDGLLLQWSWDERSLSGFDHRQAVRDFQAGRPIEARTLRGLRILDGHTAAIRKISFGSRDGQPIMLSTGHDHTIRLWDVETGVEVGTLRGHGRWVRCCDLSPDGDWIVSAGFDGVARLWETGQSGETQVLQAQTLRGHDDSILDADFSADGKYVITASRDRTARRWNAETGQLDATYREGHSFLTRRVIMHGDGQSMVTAGVDGSVRFWSLDDGREIRSWTGTGRTGLLGLSNDGNWVLTGDVTEGLHLHAIASDQTIDLPAAHAAAPTAVAFAPTTISLVTGDERGRLVFWDAESIEQMENAKHQALRHHTDRITDVVWLNDSQFVSASRDRTIALWDRNDLENPRVLGIGEEVQGLAQVQNSLLVLGRLGTLKLINTSDMSEASQLSLKGQLTPEQTQQLRTTRVAYEPKTNRIAVVDEGLRRLHWVGLDDNVLTYAPAGTNVAETRADLFSDLADIDFSLDGDAIAVVGGATSRLLDADEATRDARGFGAVRRSFEAQDVLSSVAIGPTAGDATMVTASWDGSLFVWNAEQKIVERKLEQGHQGRVTAVAMDETGSTVASVDDRGRLVLWDRLTGQRVQVVETGAPIRALDFVAGANGEPAESVLIGNDEGNVVRIGWDGQVMTQWEAQEGAVLAVKSQRFDQQLYVLTAGTDNVASSWRLAIQDREQAPILVNQFIGHSAAVNDVDWSPSGNRVVTGSDDFTVKLWDAATGKELLTLRGHDREVTTAGFDASGQRVLSAAHDGLAIVWLAPDTSSPAADSPEGDDQAGTQVTAEQGVAVQVEQ